MKISPLHPVILFSPSMHHNANASSPAVGNHSMQHTIQGALSSFLEMWLPMFIAMAIKIPGINSLTKFIRIPLEIILKALAGLGLSEIIKFVARSNSAPNH